MFEGTTLNLQGREFIAPYIPIKAFRAHPDWLKAVEAIDSFPTPEQIEAVVGLVHAALVRNYPELTTDDVEGLLDVGNMIPTLTAVMTPTPARFAATAGGRE